MDRGHVGFMSMCLPIELGGDHALGHCQNCHLLRCANCVHLGIGKFDLPGFCMVDQFVAVHKIDADDIVVQFGDHIHWVGELSSFDPEVHFVNPYGVHCISGCGDAALSVGDLPWFLCSKCSIK